MRLELSQMHQHPSPFIRISRGLCLSFCCKKNNNAIRKRLLMLQYHWGLFLKHMVADITHEELSIFIYLKQKSPGLKEIGGAPFLKYPPAAVAIVRLSPSYCGSANDFDRKLQIV